MECALKYGMWGLLRHEKSLKPRIWLLYKLDIPVCLEQSGEPGLVDRVLALHAGSRGFDSHRGHMSERFFRSNRPGYLHPVSWKIVVSEWRSVIAVSLNVGGGIRLIKPAKLCMYTQNTTNTTRTHSSGCVRPWFRTAEPLGERYENWNTHPHTLFRAKDILKLSCVNNLFQNFWF